MHTHSHIQVPVCYTDTDASENTHTHTHTPQYYSSLPPQNCLLQQERLKCDRRSLSSPPSRTLATALATGPPPPAPPPPTKLSAWKLPEFPSRSANRNQLRPPSPARLSHALHGPGQCASDHPQPPPSGLLSPRKPVLTNSRPLQPSDTRSLGFQGWDSHAPALLLGRCSKVSSRPVE